MPEPYQMAGIGFPIYSETCQMVGIGRIGEGQISAILARCHMIGIGSSVASVEGGIVPST
jgi:hypothetical protein